jgi:hypothetical protein
MVPKAKGRPPWTTPEQADFLLGFVGDLEKEKRGGGLTLFYDCVSRQFLAKWPANPADEDKEKATASGISPQEVSEARWTNVCFFSLTVIKH